MNPNTYNEYSSRNRLKGPLSHLLEHPVPDDFDPDEISWITDKVGITDMEGAAEAFLTGNYVINVAPELERVTKDVDDITIPFSIRDGLKAALIRCADLIQTVLQKDPNNKVVIHCAMGMERAPLAVVGYLVNYHDMSVDDAYKAIAAKRPIVLDRRHWVDDEAWA